MGEPHTNTAEDFILHIDGQKEEYRERSTEELFCDWWNSSLNDECNTCCTITVPSRMEWEFAPVPLTASGNLDFFLTLIVTDYIRVGFGVYCGLSLLSKPQST